MKVEINKKSRIPKYVQIVDRIKDQIGEGILLPDDRLITERELSSELGVSRNTVSQAYRILEQEGFIESRVGQGTFVTDNSLNAGKPRSQMLFRHVKHTIEEGLALGFSLTELETAVHDYIEDRSKMLESVIMVFIECNFEQANYFSHHLDLSPDVEIVPLLLDDLQKKTKNALTEIKRADIIVTSFYHLSEVQRLVRFKEKEIIGVSLEADVATLIRIAKFSPSGNLGIITTSEQFLHEIKRVLHRNQLNYASLLGASRKEALNFKKIINECDVIIVSPGRKQEVQEKAKKGTEVVEFMFAPDRTSINNLKLILLDLENKKTREK